MDISDTCFIELVVEVFSGADHIVEIATFLHLELVLPTVRNIARDVQASILGHWGNYYSITCWRACPNDTLFPRVMMLGNVLESET